MPEFRALDVPATEDLRDLSQLLRQRDVPHRISEQRDRQVVWVPDAALCDAVDEAYRDFRQGTWQPAPVEVSARPSGSRAAAAARIPVTLFLLLASLFGAAAVSLNFELAALFTFQKLAMVGDELQMQSPGAEYWRLITPIFLHFGALHIVFNALWLWELGRRIEVRHGSLQLLGVTLLMGIGSNLAQAVYSPEAVFGGMSGVIYGYLGYIMIWNRLRPAHAFDVPNSVIIFLLVWMVVCMTGVVSMVGMGDIANAAHVGGLVMGMVLGLIAFAVVRD